MSIDKHFEESIAFEIAKDLRKYKRDDKVEAIFVNTYENSDETLIIDLVLIGDEKLNIKKLPKFKIYEKDKKAKYNIYSEDKLLYNLRMKGSKENEACIDLFNGEILFDRTGRYTKLKEDITNKLIERKLVRSRTFSNKVEFSKPVKEYIKKRV